MPGGFDGGELDAASAVFVCYQRLQLLEILAVRLRPRCPPSLVRDRCPGSGRRHDLPAGRPRLPGRWREDGQRLLDRRRLRRAPVEPAGQLPDEAAVSVAGAALRRPVTGLGLVSGQEHPCLLVSSHRREERQPVRDSHLPPLRTAVRSCRLGSRRFRRDPPLEFHVDRRRVGEPRDHPRRVPLDPVDDLHRRRTGVAGSGQRDAEAGRASGDLVVDQDRSRRQRQQRHQVQCRLVPDADPGGDLDRPSRRPAERRPDDLDCQHDTVVAGARHRGNRPHRRGDAAVGQIPADPPVPRQSLGHRRLEQRKRPLDPVTLAAHPAIIPVARSDRADAAPSPTSRRRPPPRLQTVLCSRPSGKAQHPGLPAARDETLARPLVLPCCGSVRRRQSVTVWLSLQHVT